MSSIPSNKQFARTYENKILINTVIMSPTIKKWQTQTFKGYLIANKLVSLCNQSHWVRRSTKTGKCMQIIFLCSRSKSPQKMGESGPQ